ncbi:TPA: glycosyltransferase, partial [Streptococcus suis]
KSLNKAIKISKGEYIVRMDTDDVSLPNRLEVLVNEISSSKNKEFDVIGSSIIEFDDEQLNKKRILDIEITKKELVKRIAPVHPSVIMRKEILNEIGGYKDYNRCEDFVLWADVLCSGGRIKIIPDVLLLYHIDINDMRKRKISKRKDEIFARFKFYRKLDAGFFDYFNIMKTVFSGILPIRIMWLYHKFRR